MEKQRTRRMTRCFNLGTMRRPGNCKQSGESPQKRNQGRCCQITKGLPQRSYYKRGWATRESKFGRKEGSSRGNSGCKQEWLKVGISIPVIWVTLVSKIPVSARLNNTDGRGERGEEEDLARRIMGVPTHSDASNRRYAEKEKCPIIPHRCFLLNVGRLGSSCEGAQGCTGDFRKVQRTSHSKGRLHEIWTKNGRVRKGGKRKAGKPQQHEKLGAYVVRLCVCLAL